MCNLYRMTKTQDEIAKLFDATDVGPPANFGEEVYPGYPGLVVAANAAGAYQVGTMSWGFPLVMKGKDGQPLKPKPVNNARTDKLDGFFWRSSFERRRCLIPLTAWAEAQGPKGAKTRTWLSLPDAETFACAGVWRKSEEFGTCYSMVMTNSAGSAAESVHNRMPVILAQGDYRRWILGSPDEAKALCQPWDNAITIDATDEAWTRGSAGTNGLL
ncbi:MAG: SOS response-associated peptidase family protein [Erythrobacter sp.]|uniref:SOS response-associated peptidase n=1 Tax=Erythrobacter sp. TaxID=1042 RepID=UPI003264FEF4